MRRFSIHSFVMKVCLIMIIVVLLIGEPCSGWWEAGCPPSDWLRGYLGVILGLIALIRLY